MAGEVGQRREEMGEEIEENEKGKWVKRWGFISKGKERGGG